MIYKSLCVAIVTYNRQQELEDTLQGLLEQSDKVFELIIVNNGKELSTSKLAEFSQAVVLNQKRNVGLSKGRNIATHHTKSDFVIFLDDDAVPAPNWIAEIKKNVNQTNCIAFRGKVEFKNRNNPLNYLNSTYDYGEKIRPTTINAECNCGIAREYILKAGGFRTDFYGMEGVEITYALVHTAKVTIYSILYLPKVIVNHEYGDDPWHLITKTFRHGKNTYILEKKYPDYRTFVHSFDHSNIVPVFPNFLTRVIVAGMRIVLTYTYKLGYYYSKFIYKDS